MVNTEVRLEQDREQKQHQQRCAGGIARGIFTDRSAPVRVGEERDQHQQPEREDESARCRWPRPASPASRSRRDVQHEPRRSGHLRRRTAAKREMTSPSSSACAAMPGKSKHGERGSLRAVGPAVKRTTPAHSCRQSGMAAALALLRCFSGWASTSRSRTARSLPVSATLSTGRARPPARRFPAARSYRIGLVVVGWLLFGPSRSSRWSTLPPLDAALGRSCRRRLRSPGTRSRAPLHSAGRRAASERSDRARRLSRT